MRLKKIFRKQYWDLTGCIHNHTSYSFDCDVALKNVIKAAKENKLDYFTINDHYNNNVKNDPALKNDLGIHIIVGAEINDPDNNHHYLVFNSDEILSGKKVEEYVKFYKNEGAIGFIAHPYEKRSSRHFRKYLWKTDELLDVNGMEIWNYSSSWLGKLNPIINGILMLIIPNIFVQKPLGKNIKLWERYQDNGKRISAIGSTDAHGTLVSKGFIKFRVLTHRKVFAAIRTNVLIEDGKEINNENILDSIKNGNSYIVNYKWGRPYNFYGGIADPDGNGVIFGEEINWTEGLRYYFHLPCMAKIKLIKNGKKIASDINDKGWFEIKEKGRYRLEITRFNFGWIYTNYIYVI